MSGIEMTLSSSTITLVQGVGAVTASVTNTSTASQRVVLQVFGGELVTRAKAAEGARDTETSPSPSSHRHSQPPSEEPPDPADWATVDESLRTIPAGATEQYSVSFDAKSASGGTYSVKLNAYSADEPPEANSGQVLTLELVLPSRGSNSEHRKFPWWIAAAAGLVVAIAAVVFFLWPRETEVPLLTGGTLEQAQVALVEAGLGGQFNPVESADPPKTVLDQDPAPGTKVEPESIVIVDVAVEQTVNVPSVFKNQAGAAVSALENRGFKVALNPSPTCALHDSDCRVQGQLPAAGERVPTGSTVILTISTGTVTPTWPTDICAQIICEQFPLKDLERFELPDLFP